MKKRNEELYLKDILEAISHIEAYTKNISYNQFSSDQMKIDAVVRNLEIIGEAAKNLSKHTKARYPDVPWRNISGMRDKVIHEYFGVDLEIIWKTVQESLLGLKKVIKKIKSEHK